MKLKIANFVLISAGTATCFALIYYLYSLNWHGEGQLTSTAPLAVPAATLATLLFASLVLRPVPRAAVAGVFLSLATATYTAEFMAAFGELRTPIWAMEGVPPDLRKELEAVAHQPGAAIDPRRRAEVVAEMRSRHVDAVPAVFLADVLGSNGSPGTADSLRLLPLGGVSRSTTVLCNESGQYVTYRSDEHGFRNPTGIWDAAHVEIATLGESFVQGYCVADGKGFVDLLRTPGRLVLNLGYSGESSLLQLAAIKEYLTRYEPKTILWFFSEGIDLSDLYDESTHPLLMRYLEPTFSQHLFTRQQEIDDLLQRLVPVWQRQSEARPPARDKTFIQELPGMLKLWHLREQADLAYGISTYDAEASMLERRRYDLLSATLRQAKRLTTQWGGRLYFVYLPSWNRYRNGSRVDEREHASVLNVVNALGIPVIDVETAFRQEADPLSLFPFRKFGHYNERGNQIAADTILAFLSKHEQSRN